METEGFKHPAVGQDGGAETFKQWARCLFLNSTKQREAIPIFAALSPFGQESVRSQWCSELRPCVLALKQDIQCLASWHYSIVHLLEPEFHALRWQMLMLSRLVIICKGLPNLTGHWTGIDQYYSKTKVEEIVAGFPELHTRWDSGRPRQLMRLICGRIEQLCMFIWRTEDREYLPELPGQRRNIEDFQDYVCCERVLEKVMETAVIYSTARSIQMRGASAAMEFGIIGGGPKISYT